MKLIEAPNFQRFDMFTIIAFTVMGIIQGEVTVFYIIYLFWFQEFIRTVIDNVFITVWKREGTVFKSVIAERFSGFFLLFVYLVFIIVLFGIMLNWDDNKLIGQNIRVFLFRNWFFNLNIILFAVEYFFYRKSQGVQNLYVGAFNKNHIILHVSIILGAVVQMIFLKYFHIEGTLGTIAVITPFLLIKGLVDYRQYKSQQPAA